MPRGTLRAVGVLTLSLLALGACGGQTSIPGFGTIVITSVTPSPVPAVAGTPLTINGGDFSVFTGQVVEVTYTATGATPFGGGTLSHVTVPGTVTSATTIDTTSPGVTICAPGVTMVTASVQVTLSSGVTATSAGSLLTLMAPTVTGINNDAMAGTTFQACIPEPFTVTGTDFGPVGGTAMVRFTSTSAAPADTPFGGAASIEVPGTITSATTITGTSPEATLFPTLGGAAGACMSLSATTSVDVTLPGGSCTPAPFMSATFAGPTLAGLAVSGFTAPAVPSTQRLNAGGPETFTLTGTGFGPAGLTATVTFQDVAAGGAFDGGVDQVSVSGTVVNATTVTGTLPTITAPRLTANLSTRVSVTCANGSGAFCNNAANFIAPPTITGVTTNLLVREGGPASFLSTCPTQMQIAGTSFAPGATASISDAGGTPLALIGSGALTTPMVGPTLITGLSPTDPTMLVDTNARARVVNPDMQFHDFTDLATPFEFKIRGHLQNTNASMIAGNHNAEMEASIDPTNSANLAFLVHNIGANTIMLSHSEDSGTTWTQTLIGPANDGLAADRIDPRCIHDRFGNLYVCYFNRAPRTMVVLQSFDNGNTFPNIRTVFMDPSIDKQFMVTGPDGANPAQEAIYVGWDTGPGATGTAGIVASGATCAGPGMALSPFSPPVQVASNPALGNFQQFSNADVGPNGDLLVVWNDRSADAGGTGPVGIRMAIDPLGLFAGPGFGASILVDTSNVGGFEPVPPEPVRTVFAIPDVAVIKSGAHLGRIVVSYSTEVPDNSDDLDVTVRFSDNGGLTFSPRIRVNDDFTTNTQMLPALRSDPVSGTLVAAWYDARNDAVNNRQIQVFASASFDGGASWQQDMQVADGTSDQATFVGIAAANEFLDYLGLRIHDGCGFVVWSDNSNFAGGGTGSCEAYVSRFQFR